MEATALWIVLGFRDSRVQGLQGFVSDITYTRYTLICVCRYIYICISLSLSRMWIWSMCSSLILDSLGLLGVKLVQHTVVVNSRKQQSHGLGFGVLGFRV